MFILPRERDQSRQRLFDALQIPASCAGRPIALCIAPETGRPAMNVKKGQFLSPEENDQCRERKFARAATTKIMLTERGTFFGYNRLVNDMAAISIMKGLGCPVIFDATHSTHSRADWAKLRAADGNLHLILAKAAIAAAQTALYRSPHKPAKKPNPTPLLFMPIEWVENC